MSFTARKCKSSWPLASRPLCRVELVWWGKKKKKKKLDRRLPIEQALESGVLERRATMPWFSAADRPFC